MKKRKLKRREKRLNQMEWDDISRLNNKQLEKLYKKELKSLKGRTERILQTFGWSPAVDYYVLKQGILTADPQTRGQYMRELAKIRRFNESSTSTVRGMKDYAKKIHKKGHPNDDGDWSDPNNYGAFISAMNYFIAFKENHPDLYNAIGSDQALVNAYKAEKMGLSFDEYVEMCVKGYESKMDEYDSINQELYDLVFGDESDY